MNQPGNALPLHRAIGLFWLLMLLSLQSGCALTYETQRVFGLAKRTTTTEPRFFEYVRSDRVAQREARLLAEQAWAEVSQDQSDISADYENGFVEGFADYLYRGGSGDPPVIPPRGYWHLRFLNRFGKANITDWYEGFRDGAADCKARGLRKMWLVPTSLVMHGAGDTSSSSGSESGQANPSESSEAGSSQQLEPNEPPPVPESIIESVLPEPFTPLIVPSDEVIEDPEGPELTAPSDGLDTPSDGPLTGPDEDGAGTFMQFRDADVPELEIPAEPNVPPAGEIQIDDQPFLEEPTDSEQDIFNFPTNDSEIETDDFDFESGDDNQALPDPFSMRQQPAATAIPAYAQPQPVRQVSQQTAASFDSRQPSVNSLRDDPSGDASIPESRAEPPLKLVFEGPRVTKPREIPATAATTKPGPSLAPPANSAAGRSNALGQGGQPVSRHVLDKSLEELLSDESMPSLPLQVGTAQRERWRGLPTKTKADTEGSPGADWTPEAARAEELPLRLRSSKSASTDAPSVGVDTALPMIINRGRLQTKPESKPKQDPPAIRWRIRD